MTFITDHEMLQPGHTLKSGSKLRLSACGHAYSFETRKFGTLRTAGVVLYQPWGKIFDLPRDQASAYAKLALARTDAAARGKVAALGDQELCVFQADTGDALRPALCGNATAAAIIALRKSAGQLQLKGPGAVRVTVEFQCFGGVVQQSWVVPAMTVTEFFWRDRYCVRVSGFNAYTIVTGGLPVGLKAETCRTRLAAGDPNAKFALVGHRSERSHIAFYNASGRHGAAPMTGLASVAFAAHVLPRFAAHLGGRAVTYRTAGGLESYTLPAIGQTTDGRLRVEMPKVEAVLTPIMQEAV